jgi:4-hydroxy-4-methyl-2-oxoglutarate aldolase
MAREEELQRVRPRLFGLIDESRITVVDINRPPRELVVQLLQLTDLASSVSDALGQLSVGGAVSASTLVPLAAGQRLVGPAITIRYLAQGGDPSALSGRGERPGLADRDLYNVGTSGDVAVFDCGGFIGASVMGGLSAAWALRTEMAGCVIDGAVRDVAAIRGQGVPVWSRGVTPVTGKHRLEAIEINGPVSVAGVAVRPGDVVVADETGVCVIPIRYVEAVKDIALAAERAERDLELAIERGASHEEIVAILRPERW